MSSTPKPYPSDALLERKVIEGLLNLPTEFAEALDLDAECFYARQLRLVFEACKSLHEHKRTIDPFLVQAQFQADAEMQGFVAALAGFPGHENLAEWCDTLRNLRALRKVQEAAMRVSAMGFGSAKNPIAFLDAASKQLAEAFEARPNAVRNTSLGELTGQVLAEMDARRNGSDTRILTTGFKSLDKALGGLEPGAVYLIAGRPGTGKSSLANQLAMNVAIQGHLSLVFNLEMKPQAIARRLLSTHAAVDSKLIKYGQTDGSQTRRVVHAAAELSKLRLEFPDIVDVTIEQIRRTARSRLRDGLRLVVIDYIQLVGSSEHHEMREQTVAAVSRGTKMMALELDIPVIALAQLNRDSEKRVGQRPNMSDLRESGSLEQDADVICLLYRDDYCNPASKEPGTADVIVAKQRDGDTGIVKMEFDKQFTRFKDRAVSYG